MGYVDLNSVSLTLPDGRVLLDEITFRVGEGRKAALIGANGAGKTTLLRILSGELNPHSGAVSRAGGLGVMPASETPHGSMAARSPTTSRHVPIGSLV